MRFRLVKALLYAVVIWIIGFVWGSIVFMTPALKNVHAIPYVSNNPAISFPILLIWVVVTYLLSTSYLKGADERSAQGLKLGVVFAFVNVLLDMLVLVFLLKAGFGFFMSLSVWVGYSMLLVIPWMVGRSLGIQNG